MTSYGTQVSVEFKPLGLMTVGMDIIASGPLMVYPPGHGLLPHAVVLRAVDEKGDPDHREVPYKYIVHTLVINENGKVSYDHGDYIHTRGDAGARARAFAKFYERMTRKLEIADPIYQAAQEVAETARLEDSDDEESPRVDEEYKVGVRKIRNLKTALGDILGR